MKLIKNKGFSLIEVLISVVILSVGLLSIAALQVNAKKATYDSIQRTTASQLASDIIERMRANNSALADYIENTPISQPTVLCTIDAPCTTASAVALYDLWEWDQMLISGLQSPTACITQATNVYTIAIAWRGVENLTQATDPVPNSCGNGSGLYGDNNEYRRILTFDVFISAGI